jgi:cytochrome c oxidase assembly protein subunit 11
MNAQNTSSSQDKNRKTAASLVALVIAMVGLSFAAVPLYRLFCQVTGFGGTTQAATTAPDKVYDREVTVQFTTQTDPDLPWEFKAEERRVKMKIGESKLVFFRAQNVSNAPTKGTATFNVTPHIAGPYFVKTECFCFEEQALKAGESIEMPMTFYIDPQILKNKELEGVTTLTLSYTFFPDLEG